VRLREFLPEVWIHPKSQVGGPGPLKLFSSGARRLQSAHPLFGQDESFAFNELGNRQTLTEDFGRSSKLFENGTHAIHERR
jgi:hypothetical protein